MPFTQQQQTAIIRALDAKLSTGCPGCSLRMREAMPNLALFPVFTMPPPPRFGGLAGLGSPSSLTFTPPPKQEGTMPCVVVVCRNCGFTEFYNVHILGLGQSLGLPSPGGLNG